MRVPIAGRARLFEQFDSGRIERADKSDPFIGGERLVCIEPDHRAPRDHFLKRPDHFDVTGEVETHFHLDRPVAGLVQVKAVLDPAAFRREGVRVWRL